MRIVQLSLFTVMSFASLELHAAGTAQPMSLDEADNIVRFGKPKSGLLTAGRIRQAFEVLEIDTEASGEKLLQYLTIAKSAVTELGGAKKRDADVLKKATLRLNLLTEMLQTTAPEVLAKYILS